MNHRQVRVQRILSILCLIIAAETIFCLPYHVARYFRPSLLLTLDLSNTELGFLQTAYGVMAMLAYIPGGMIADLFPARRLLTASLVCTGFGGFYFATLPGYNGLWPLFAFWGLTSILLFWGALIRATREWGTARSQGRAYGFLDGGRGLLAAAMATVAVIIFGLTFPSDPTQVTPEGRASALRSVILFYTAITFLAALCTWFFVQEPTEKDPSSKKAHLSKKQLRQLFQTKTLWLQAGIIICAYVTFKGVDNYSLFAAQAWGFTEVESAKLSALSTWIRPMAAVAAGYLADRFLSSRIISLSFVGLVFWYLFFGLSQPAPSMVGLLITGVLMTSCAVFAMRAVYFALLEEGHIKAASTGTAVGIVSFIGYSPDVFQGPLSGWLLDHSPGATGHMNYFLALALFAGVGFIISLWFTKETRKKT
ncbi:MAG: MFS transporter [Deltaproteobacteria bacterium]|nr:MFS transporter [Deltaproteobacteria bacterium]